MASLPGDINHEPQGFVAPSSFLNRPRGQSHLASPVSPPSTQTESESAIDRDQRLGLVGLATSIFWLKGFEGIPKTIFDLLSQLPFLVFDD